MAENDSAEVDVNAASKTPSELRSRQLRSRTRHEVQDEVPAHAMARKMPDRMARALDLVRECARIADDNRAKDILLLDLHRATPIVDFFLIATASSRRQSHAIASEIDQQMKKRGEAKLGMEGSEEGRWVLIDYGDFVVHIFSPEGRTYYALEEIWGDAPQLDWSDGVSPSAGNGARPDRDVDAGSVAVDPATSARVEADQEPGDEPAGSDEADEPTPNP